MDNIEILMLDKIEEHGVHGISAESLFSYMQKKGFKTMHVRQRLVRLASDHVIDVSGDWIIRKIQ